MFTRYSKVHIHFSGLSGSIQCSFYQMFFQRSTYAISITVEFQQTFWQRTIIQSCRFQQVSYYSLIIMFRQKSLNILTCIIQASSIQIIIKSKTMNMIEKFLFKTCSRHVIISTQEFEQVFKHTACRSRSWHKLHDFLIRVFISIPCCQIFFLGISIGNHNTIIVYRCSRSQLQIRESLFKASQLLFNLLLSNTFLCQ